MFDRFSRWLPRGRANRPSPQHLVAVRYWGNCSNTFLANSDYYEKCEVELRTSVLPRLGRAGRLLDAGCGNGRFTFLLAEACNTVDACDVSPTLIKQARETAKSRGARNIHFHVGDITSARWQKYSYDAVSCMGVLSTIIDEPVFLDLIDKIRNAVRPGGLVLLRDTVSLLPEGQLVQSDTYAIRYRHEGCYRRTMANLGMGLEYETRLIEAETLVNRMFVYRVHSASAR
jgi:2-polyprenyl-3-methyl-5-hydroxy-6-metoxy-1,4-benzoquinol methylase